MENKKSPSFFMIVVALILGQALYAQFDFENLKFEKPALAGIYLIVFAFAIYSIIKSLIKQPEK